MTGKSYDLGDFLVFLRKTRETPPYPWEPFTHRGRVAHNRRWQERRAQRVRLRARESGIAIPESWSDEDVCGVYLMLCTTVYDVPGFEPRGHVVDVGASCGDYAVVTARRPEVTEVLALEPAPHNAQRAREFIALNHARARLIEAAAGSRTGRMWLGDAGSGAVSVLSDRQGFEVEVVALDDLPIDHIDFVKINVEGAELAVLEGAQRTLSFHRPRLAVSVHSRALAASVDQFLSRFGYRLAYHDRGVRASYPMDLVQNRFYLPTEPIEGVGVP